MGASIAAWLVEAGVEYILATEIAAAVIWVGQVVALTALSRALTRQPGQGNIGGVISATGRNLSIRQAISPWQVVIGQQRVGGIVSFVFLGTDKKFLHVVVTLACHECEEIGDIWLDDEVITSAMLNAEGEVTTGRFVNQIQVPHAEFFSVSPATVAHVLSSVEAVSSNKIDAEGSSFTIQLEDVSPSAPTAGQYSRSGQTFTLHSDDSADFAINYSGPVSSPVRIKKSLGDEAGQPFPDLVSESEGKWTDAHKQAGHTKLYIRFNTSLLEAGSPAMSAVLKGAKLYDPRTGLTVWSANPPLAVRRYLTDPEWGLGAGAAEIGDAEFIAAADICDEAVDLAAGGTEPRYEANGAFKLSERPVDILERLLASMAGDLTHVSDTWRVFAGGYEAATLTLTEKDFAGGIQIDPMPPRDRWANGAKGVFVNPGSNWQPTDFPAIEPTAGYLAEDGGETIYVDLDYSTYITSSSQAQRLARIEVRQRRFGLTVTALFKLTAWRAFTGHSVALTFAKYGWAAKEFSILQAGFSVIQGDRGPTLGVRMVLRETAASVYAWDAEDAAQGTPPSTNLPNPLSVDAPGAPMVNEVIYETSGSAGVKSRAEVSWTAVVDPLVKNYEVGWKNVNDAAYQIRTVPQGTAYNVEDLGAGLFLFAVRAFNGIVKSDWSPYTTKQLLGLTAAPEDATGFSVIASNGFAVARWDLSPDLDVRIGGRAVVRFSTLTTGAAWENGILLHGSVDSPGFNGDAVMSGPMALATGTYMFKFLDSSENYSTNMVAFVATQTLVQGYTVVATVTEDPGFTGAKNTVVVTGSTLELSLKSNGLVNEFGSYAFAATTDLTTVASRRFEATITALSYNIGDLIDSEELWDSSDPIDGGTVNDCNVTLYARTTPDNPAGSPTAAVWSEWTPFMVADFNCRAAQFRLDFFSGDASHNIAVSQLRVVIKTSP